MNSWWAPRGTLLVEFMPLKWFMTPFWEEGSTMGHHYWSIPVEGDVGHNIVVPPADVAQIVREQLGKDAVNDPTPHSEWDLGQLTR